MIDYQDIGIKVAARRRELGMSQGDLALRAGVVRQTVARIERGEASHVSLGTVIAVLSEVGYDLTLDLGIAAPQRSRGELDVERYLDERFYGGFNGSR